MKLVIYILAALSIQTCTHKKPKKKKKVSKEQSYITLLDVTSDSKVSPKKPNNIKENPKKITHNNKKKEETIEFCRVVTTKIISHLKKLKSSLVESNGQVKPNVPLWDATELTNKNCTNSQESQKTLKLISDALNHHNGKIGIILPLTGPQKDTSWPIVAGLKAAMGQYEEKFEQFFIVKDSKGTDQGFYEAYSSLLFENPVSMIIGGMQTQEAKLLNQYSRLFFIPTILLNSNQNLTANKYKFHVFPREEHLAETLAKALHRKNIKTVAIFHPKTSDPQTFTQHLKIQLKALNIEVNKEADYIPGNYPSMEEAVKNLANIDYVKRKEEYEIVYQTALEIAEQKNVPFNPRMVILPPDVEADALVIPDDFRIVKHFVKLIKYHKIDHLKIVGSHEWRSQGIIEPWEPYLHGSLFVDFVGSYEKLPKGLKVETSDSPYFINPTKVMDTDLKLIGHRAGSIALRALSNKKVRRRDMAESIKGLKSQNGFYSSEHIFNEDNFSSWPTYVFSIHDKRLLLNEPSR